MVTKRQTDELATGLTPPRKQNNNNNNNNKNKINGMNIKASSGFEMGTNMLNQTTIPVEATSLAAARAGEKNLRRKMSKGFDSVPSIR
jgi:hypothetical protein